MRFLINLNRKKERLHMNFDIKKKEHKNKLRIEQAVYIAEVAYMCTNKYLDIPRKAGFWHIKKRALKAWASSGSSQNS